MCTSFRHNDLLSRTELTSEVYRPGHGASTQLQAGLAVLLRRRYGEPLKMLRRSALRAARNS